MKIMGEMEGHLQEIVEMRPFKSLEYGHDGIISFSKNEIFFWDLFYGYHYFNITIDHPYYVSNLYA